MEILQLPKLHSLRTLRACGSVHCYEECQSQRGQFGFVLTMESTRTTCLQCQ
jgi:hypothetical protein